MKRIVVLKGNPTPEELALIVARLQSTHKAPEPTSANAGPLSPWQQQAHSEQLDRWPARLGDSHWRV